MRSTLPLDIGLSRKLAALVDAENGQCWVNSVYGLVRARRLLGEDAVYVEGWATGYLPVAHGWIEIPGVAIVDPTPAWHDERKLERTYFPAARYTEDDIAAMYRADEFGEEGDQELVLPLTPGGHSDNLTEERWRRAYLEASVWMMGKEGVLKMYRDMMKWPDAEAMIEDAEENRDAEEEEGTEGTGHPLRGVQEAVAG